MTAVLQSSACLNVYRTLLNGTVEYNDAQHCKLHEKEIDRLELGGLLSSTDHDSSLTFQERSDQGALLIYLGRYKDAISIYRNLLRDHADEYVLHSNLGTAFELIGENDSALIHIKRAVQLEPGSHGGSEWIHIRILEYKVAAGKGHPPSSILDLAFGENSVPNRPSGQDLNELREHLSIQLAERMTFVKPKDLIVGELLFELGNLDALTSSVECALQRYEQSEEYGYSTTVFHARKRHLEKLTLKARLLNKFDPASDASDLTWNDYFTLSLIVIPILLIIGVVLLILRMIKRRRQRQ